MGARRKDAKTLPGTTTRTTPETNTDKRAAGTVAIEIRGKRLAIRTDHDPMFVHELARHVDDKLRQLQSMAPATPFDKLMMLVSLNLAEELFEAQDELAILRQDISERTDAMLALIEEEAGQFGE